MDGDIEITSTKKLKSIIVICGWMARFISGQIKTDNPTIAELDGQLSRCQGYCRIHVAKRANDNPHIDTRLVATRRDAREYCLQYRRRI